MQHDKNTFKAKRHDLTISCLCFFMLFAGLSAGNAQGRKVYTTTPTYDELISTFRKLDKASNTDTLIEAGTTDIGRPLHLYIISRDKIFTPTDRAGKTVVFINNGIHPGEPDGIDASIELVQAIQKNPELLSRDVILCIVPVFNVDGCLNRGKFSRANQNGPEEYGFRGNAKNLDLNRDFVKCDSKNAQSLQQVFAAWRPELFIDTHVSNGADYQYTMTLIASQHNKLQPLLGDYMQQTAVPFIYSDMKKRGHAICPYVDTRGQTPESGLVDFLETPRFSTGYAAQHNCLGFVTETHMWKPYNDRVWATYDILLSFIAFTNKECKKLQELHAKADMATMTQQRFPVNYRLDTNVFHPIPFNGFEATYKTSNISGQQRLYYDRSKPWTKNINYYDTYRAADTVVKPYAYIIPQAWTAVIERFTLNGVPMRRLTKDTALTCAMHYIEKYETAKSPYESHYQHWDVKLRTVTATVQFRQGDYVVITGQPTDRYVVEALEPKHNDSFFCWNFFDGILNQKEWFSDYIFEEKAEEILKNNPALQQELEEKRKTDKEFASNHWAQINFVYQHSEFKELTHNRYPVGRLLSEMKLPLSK